MNTDIEDRHETSASLSNERHEGTPESCSSESCSPEAAAAERMLRALEVRDLETQQQSETPRDAPSNDSPGVSQLSPSGSDSPIAEAPAGAETSSDGELPRPFGSTGGTNWPLVILTTFASLAAAYVARGVLVPVAFALMLALTLRPIVRQLKRRGMPVSVGSAAVLLLVIFSLLTGVTYLVGPAKDWVDNAPEDLKTVGQKLSPILSPWKQIQEASEELENLGADSKTDDDNEPVEKGVADGAVGRPHDVADASAHPLESNQRRQEPVAVEVKQPRLESNLIILSSAGSFLTESVVVLVLTFFLLTSSDVLINNVLRILPTMRDKRRIVELVYNVEHGISSYLLTVACINIGLGLVEGVAMWLLGMPNPALWGAVCCVLNFIPYLGAMVGSIIVFLVAVLTFDKLEYAVLVPIVYFSINAVEGNVVTPAILGKSMQLNPVIVFLFLTFWGWMWGIPGAILAVPILAVLKIGFEQFERTQPIATLLTG